MTDGHHLTDTRHLAWRCYELRVIRCARTADCQRGKILIDAPLLHTAPLYMPARHSRPRQPVLADSLAALLLTAARGHRIIAWATNDGRGHEAGRPHRFNSVDRPDHSQGPLVLVRICSTYVPTVLLARQGSLVVVNMFGAPPAARDAWRILEVHQS